MLILFFRAISKAIKFAAEPMIVPFAPKQAPKDNAHHKTASWLLSDSCKAATTLIIAAVYGTALKKEADRAEKGVSNNDNNCSLLPEISISTFEKETIIPVFSTAPSTIKSPAKKK